MIRCVTLLFTPHWVSECPEGRRGGSRFCINDILLPSWSYWLLNFRPLIWNLSFGGLAQDNKPANDYVTSVNMKSIPRGLSRWLLKSSGDTVVVLVSTLQKNRPLNMFRSPRPSPAHTMACLTQTPGALLRLLFVLYGGHNRGHIQVENASFSLANNMSWIAEWQVRGTWEPNQLSVALPLSNSVFTCLCLPCSE